VAAPRTSATNPTTAARVGGHVRRAWRSLIARQVFVTLIVFLLVFVFLSLRTDTFLTPQNLSALMRNISWLAIVALGQMMVIVIGGIDLTVGAVMALAGLLASRAMQMGAPISVAVLVGLGVGLLIGMVNGLLTAHIRLPAFVVTLATMSIARGFAYNLTRGWPVTNLPPEFVGLAQAELALGPWVVPAPFIFALAVTVIIRWLLTRTVFGGDVYAVSSGERALIVTGVNVKRLKVVVYSLSGLLAALGGLVFVARLGVAQPTAAIGYEIDVIAAAVIGGASLFGGVGSATGVLLGAAITQMLYNGLVLLGGPSDWQLTLIGAAILLAILFDYWRRRRQGMHHGATAQGS
jgi:ribose transport system permease protein